jgi:hypothetical protein
MTKLVVRDLNPEVVARLEVRARTHGCSLESEARALLEAAPLPTPGRESHDEPGERTYSYSIQGVLYEMADPDYLNPEGRISFEVDARDGRQWVCHLDKAMAPDNLQDLWRTEVLVTGTATFQPGKAVLDVATFRSLPGVSDPVQAMDELITLCGGEPGDEPVQAFMDRVRERD